MGQHCQDAGKVKVRIENTGTSWKTTQLLSADSRLPCHLDRLCSDSCVSPAHGSLRTRLVASVLGVKMVPEKHLVGPEPTRGALGTLRMLVFFFK